MLGLANCYDGLDLPGDACRIVVLGGKPDAVGLQERFLSERAEANAALAERVRTRIVQGAGRCTRGPNDYAVVVVLGSDIMKYFSRPENLRALEPELQAEVEFGWQNSKGADPDEVIENVEMFLAHDADWRAQGEPMVAEFRQDAVKVDSPAADALGKAAALEVEAWPLVGTGSVLARSCRKRCLTSVRRRPVATVACCSTSVACGSTSGRKMRRSVPVLASWSGRPLWRPTAAPG